jgi:ATP-independent RNA helicase DbpA
MILHYVSESAIIFCNTKLMADEVAYTLQNDGFSALALHGDLDQRERNEMLVRFANRSCNILVATDMAARGLDIADVGTVINYELPLDPEVYIHRIGRTGRAGKSGVALSLVTPKQNAALKRIEAYSNATITLQNSDNIDKAVVHPREAPMRTLLIFGGKKQKLRPGDIVGALTGDAGIDNAKLGKIDRFDNATYIAIEAKTAPMALKRLNQGKIKGRKFKTVMIG